MITENKNVEAIHRKLHEWEKKPNFLEELREYFETTSREQILKDWEATKKWDNEGVIVEKVVFSTEGIKQEKKI